MSEAEPEAVAQAASGCEACPLEASPPEAPAPGEPASLGEASAEAPEPAGPAKFQGAMSLIKRGDSDAFPSLEEMSESVWKRFKEPYQKRKKDRKPQIRLFVFYGVADSMGDWSEFVVYAPLWSEVAVYECKAHGVRADEPWDKDLNERCDDAWAGLRPILEEHAPGGPFAGAPFAFISHSSGAQLAVLVAKRVRDELCLEPAAMFIQDRAPPNVKAISDFGHKTLKKDPLEFFWHFSPGICGLLQNSASNPLAAKLAERWKNGMQMSQEYECKQGYHMFACPVYVFVSGASFEQDATFLKKALKPEEVESHKRRAKVTQSLKDSVADWDLKQFNMWKRWTTGECHVKQVATTHAETRFHDEVQEVIWSVCRKVVEE